MSAAEWIDGDRGEVLLLCDHASAEVPDDIELGIEPRLLSLHVALDIGAAEVTRGLAALLGAPAILGTVSRLVIDLHREPEHPGLVPLHSDGHAIPGNAAASIDERVARFHAPYHRFIEDRIRARRPRLILAVHSFTPRLEQAGVPRPWEVGVLYNQDARAAVPAIEWLAGEGLIVGDNEPYSGRLLNATLNRHAEANDIPSMAIEIRNDLIAGPAGQQAWSERLTRLAEHLLQAAM